MKNVLIGITAAVLIALIAVIARPSDSPDVEASHGSTAGTVDNLAVDTDTTGNQANSLPVDAIDTCNTIAALPVGVVSSSAAFPTVITTSAPHGLTTGDRVDIIGHNVGLVNTVSTVTVLTGTTFEFDGVPSTGGTGGTMAGVIDVDVIVDEVDPTDLMLGWSWNLDYNQSVVEIIDVDRLQMIAAATNSGAGGGFIEVGAENPTSTSPDTSGRLVELIADFGFGFPADTIHESGEGVLARITLRAAATGLSALTVMGTITNPLAVIAPPAPGTQLVDSSTIIGNAQVAVGIGCPDPPVADPDTVSTDEGTDLPITLTGSDPNGCAGESYTFTIVDQPDNGDVSPASGDATCVEGGSGDLSAEVTYSPDVNFNGDDPFTFKFTDTVDLDSNTATVSLTVNPVNDAPILGVIPDDSFSQGGSLFIDLDDFYSDVETAAADAAFSVDTCPGGFTCDLNGTTHVLTVSNAALGDGDVTVGVTDRGDPDNCGTPNGDCDATLFDTDTFKVASTPFNNPPDLSGIPDIDFPEDGSDNSIDLDDYYDDVETAAADATFEVVSAFTGISASVNASTHVLTVSGDTDFNGEGDITVKATDRGNPDGCGDPSATCAADQSDEDTFHVTVTPVNDAPTCENVSITTDEDTQGSTAPDCDDVDGDDLTFEIVDQPTPGDASVGSLLYDPDADFAGSDSFTYKANDGSADSNVADVSVAVLPINDAPVCEDVSITTDEDTQGSTEPDCDDVEGDELTYAIVDQPSHGEASVGSLLYDPDPHFSGSDSFTYKANDGSADSSTANVSVTVTEDFADAPTADPQAVTTTAGASVEITLTGDDIDGCGGGQDFTFEIVVLPVNGDVSADSGAATCLAGDLSASVTYTPDDGFDGDDSFDFVFNDGTTDSNTTTVTITVEPDADGDGVADTADNCTGTASDATVDANGCTAADVDSDGDGICNPGTTSSFCTGSDNCPSDANADQKDTDGDGEGDACDSDDDGDGFSDSEETAAGSDVLDADSTPENTLAACSDGIDNDKDSNTDSADSGCTAVLAAAAGPTAGPTELPDGGGAPPPASSGWLAAYLAAAAILGLITFALYGAQRRRSGNR